jgi:chromosome segregation ATPase
VGVPQDYFEAALWFRQAAEAGVPEAQYNLGLAYEIGRGLAKDETLAQRWYRAAAEQNYARARYNLALMLEEGRGSAMDEAMAAQLYRTAALQGFGPAQNNYGIMLAEGRGGLASNFKEAYAWLALAAENGVTAVGRDLVAARLQPAELAEARARQEAIKAQMEGRTIAPAAIPTSGSEVATRQLAELGDQLRNAQGEMDRLRAENTRLAGTVQAIQSEKIQLERKRAQLAAETRPGAPDRRAEAEMVALQAANRDLTARLAGLQQELRRAQETTAELQAENGRLSRAAGDGAALAQLRTQVAELTRETESLKAERTNLVGRNQEITAELQSLGAARSRLEEENRRLTGLAASAPASGDERTQFLTAENTRLNNEVKRATVELANLNRRLRLAEERAAAGGATTGGEDPRLAALQRQLDDERAAASRLADENRRLQQAAPGPDAPALQALRQELSAATTELAALRVERVQLEQRLAAATGDDSRLRAEQERWQRELAVMEQQLQQARQELTAAQQAAGSSMAELTKTKDALARSEQNLAAATRELQSRPQLRAEEREQTQAERNRLQSELAEAQAQMVAARRETEELRVQLQAAQSDAAVQVNRLRNQLATAQQTVTAVESTSRDQAADLAAFAARVQALQQENTALRGDRAGAEVAGVRVQALEKALGDAERKLTEATRELRARAETGESENAKLTAELGRLQGALGDQQAGNTALRREVESLREQLQSAQVGAESQLGRLREQLTAAQQALLEAETAGKDQAAGLTELSNRYEILQREHTALRTARASSEAAVNRLQALEAELAESRRVGERLGADVTRLTEQNRQLAASAAARADDDTVSKLTAQLAAAARTLETREQALAGMQAQVNSLEQDLAVSRQEAAAALAAQALAARALAARALPDATAMRLEMQSLQDRARQLELQLATDQKSAAQEIAQLA